MGVADALGAVSDALGAKRTLQLCSLISLAGSIAYALGDYVHNAWGHGAETVLLARLLQGSKPPSRHVELPGGGIPLPGEHPKSRLAVNAWRWRRDGHVLQHRRGAVVEGAERHRGAVGAQGGR